MLSIEQKQKIYKELLEKDCPDLLAALIAERATLYPVERESISDYIWNSFHWVEALEGFSFWSTMVDCLDYPEIGVETPELVIEKDVPVISDYETCAAASRIVELSVAQETSSSSTETHTKATPPDYYNDEPKLSKAAINYTVLGGLFIGWLLSKILLS